MYHSIHCIGIGGIGVSAIARYYVNCGIRVSGSDTSRSDLTDTLATEGITVTIGDNPAYIPEDTDLVIYSEAIITKPDIPKEQNLLANVQLAEAIARHIPLRSYPEALAEIFDAAHGIAVCGSHGKSTTTGMLGVVLMGSSIGGSTLVGTLLPQFDGKNIHMEPSENFVIEACEYKRSFLRYHPAMTVVTNIDIDHLDYYRDTDDYVSAFASLLDQTRGWMVLSGDCSNSRRLYDAARPQAWVYTEHYTRNDRPGEIFPLPPLTLHVPGRHLLHDAHLVYVTATLLGLDDAFIRARLESYAGSWRRSEIVRTTAHGNILMSDYGHHPTEIRATLGAIRERYANRRLFVVFQPHQYSRTIELLKDFCTAFDAADELIIPDIYFSRDSESDVHAMPPERFVAMLREYYPQARYGDGLATTAEIIREYDANHWWDSVILLLGAGSVDDLRKKIL